MRQVLRVARYRFRATFARRWGGLLAIVLLVGLLGGLAMGAVAGARRTQSSFPAYLARTNASDVAISNAFYNQTGSAFDARVSTKIARLPHVERPLEFLRWRRSVPSARSSTRASRSTGPSSASASQSS